MTTTWFITGGSKGIGFETAKLALSRGDNVVSFSRTEGKLKELKSRYSDTLLVLLGNIKNREEVVQAAAQGVEAYGQIDIALSNAGVMSGGMIEETNELEAREIMDINFFGSLWTAQAVAPYMREQKKGHFIQVSSIGGFMSWMTSGLYSASKFAVEGMTEALAQELAPFSINTTIVEPGGYWTDLYKDLKSSPRLPAYDELHAQIDEYAKSLEGQATDSDPQLAGEAIIKLVDVSHPPLRLLLTNSLFDSAIEGMQERIKEWRKGEAISRSAEKLIPMPENYLEK